MEQWKETSRDRVGAISKAQKYQNDFQVSIYSTRQSKSQKNGPSGAPVTASASSWRAKEKKFSKKVSQCRKTEKGTLCGFSTSILSQNSKKIQGGPFGKFFFEKSLTVPTKIERGSCPVWYVTQENRKTFFGSVC